ncbi:alpha/beta superfamily hydrolase [Panacagrimonas perspica]|uniref:Alpha/beta superfamily hydrolase n=1 Tax=Panacagrimonas perspica TaxID=381431 RepID=A0A4S3KAR9_9GAMM|nr:YqiA/YcfP family alpha/beta fold hydrolase [Panacagrimonas perspica]TDU32485.1 alpha/beta superfamily hydrolase [Panacagrimonas perspica]THD05399.1 alpha/beta hydrolase [Panacagrimonas perspica]
MSVERLVCFAHGKESGPWGTKITRLAEVARARGFEVMSPDYSGTHDPHERVRILLDLAPRARHLVLVGSSMGGYVSAQACAALQPSALFLMAPALYFPHWEEEPEGIPEHCCVVHGWSDDIVPVDRAQRFAERHHAELHLLHSGHTLNDQLPILGFLLDRMLQRTLGG